MNCAQVADRWQRDSRMEVCMACHGKDGQMMHMLTICCLIPDLAAQHVHSIACPASNDGAYHSLYANLCNLANDRR